jgi:hypothetical protein
MKAEVFDACLGAQPLPSRLGSGHRHWVSLATHTAQPFVGAGRDIGEAKLWMLAPQWKQYLADGVGDWKHHAIAALADAHDLLDTEEFTSLQRNVMQSRCRSPSRVVISR